MMFMGGSSYLFQLRQLGMLLYLQHTVSVV